MPSSQLSEIKTQIAQLQRGEAEIIKNERIAVVKDIKVQFIELTQKAFSEAEINTLEPWSADILTNLYSLNISPSDKQLIMF